MAVANVVSVSGGKDSTALLLCAIERGEEFQAVFADTGHEHVLTYEYIGYLEQVLGIEIRRVRADFTDQFPRKRAFIAEKWPLDGVPQERVEAALAAMHPTGIPFLDLCMMKGRFPSTRARFCSQDLKHVPIRRFVVDPLLDAGNTVVSWQGVRADESPARAKLAPIEEVEEDLWVYRPILAKTADEVFADHRRHGIKPNPLYTMGFSRVGCMPCLHSGKRELRAMAMYCPEEVERVVRWEETVIACSKRGAATFFAADKTPGAHTIDHSLPMPRLDEVMEWAKTARGGRQYDLLATGEEPSMCSSVYGLCE